MLLLVDNRDGTIVAELHTQEDIELILETWAREDTPLREYLCIVEGQSHHGPLMGVDRSVKVRPLT